MYSDARRAYHIARVDFLARLRTRKLLVFLAAVIYVGYLINSGSFGVFYTVSDGPSVNGALTAPLVGLNAGMAGSTVMLLAGFYVLRGGLERDARHGHTPLLTSSQTSEPVYLLGKLLSHVAVGTLTAAVLAGAAVINHAVYGVGSTEPVAISWPVFVMVVPLTVFVGAIALLFGAVDPLAGTLGRIGYFFGATFLISAQLLRPESAVPAAIPLPVKAFDVVGITLAYDLTFESIRAAVPAFESGYANFGTGGSTAETFRYEGGRWPLWFFAQRVGTVATGVVVTLVATLPFNWARSSDGVLARIRRRLPFGRTGPRPTGSTGQDTGATTPADEPNTPSATREDASLPSVGRRDAGGLHRVLRLEFRRLLRGQPRWWYLGTGALVTVPTAVAATGGADESLARGLLPLVAVWPLFVWSQVGSQTARHGVRPQLLSSTYPVGQLFAEWLAGCLVTVTVGIGVFAVLAATTGLSAAVGVVGLVVFPPSLALATGLWTGSPRLFEASYLGLWYVGPLNGGYVADFAGVTARGTAAGVPLVFAAVGVGLVAVAAQRRRVYSTVR
jgi:hypothetical protein